ncbi:MAG: alpha-amylase, partial [Bacteroidetes bacterium]
YDTLKKVLAGEASTDRITGIQQELADISGHMLHFMENHDEQRIASSGFAGDARKGKPAMVVSATIDGGPVMVYFGQEVGEPAAGDAGFGSATRTTIFDYWGVPHHVRWMNDGAFDGGQLTPEEKELREFYRRLLNFTLGSKALTGEYREIHTYNRHHTEWYNDRVFSFARWKGDERLIVVVNFDASEAFGFELQLPADLVAGWGLDDGSYTLTDQMNTGTPVIRVLRVDHGNARVRIDIDPLGSLILSVGT